MPNFITANALAARRLRHRDPERERATHARYRDKRRLWLDQQKSKPCLDCNSSFPPECMDFDHVRGRKAFTVSSSYARVAQAALVREIKKCDLVCANCHRIRTAARGVPWQRNRERIERRQQEI